MNIGLIGYGYWGPNLARNISSIEEMKFVALCEIDISRLNKAKTLYENKITVYTNNYLDILENKEIDAVIVATQTVYSYQIIMDCLKAGKHVFVEKPIASSVENTSKIIDLAYKNKLIVHCDHIMIYNPIIKYIKKLIDDGELGDLLYFDISRMNLGPIRKDVNAMLDLAVHDIAVIDFLSDGVELENLVILGQKNFGNQETLTYLTLKYTGFIAHIKSSWVSPLKERRTMIAGTKKMIVFDDVKNTEKLTIYNHGFDICMNDEYGIYEVETRTGDVFIPNIKYEDSLRNSLIHFLECINEKKESLSGPTHSLRVMKILEKAMFELRNDL